MEIREKAIDLEYFIRNFIPKGFKEPIHFFDYSPSITPENYTYFEQNYNSENFEYLMNIYSDCQFRDIKIYRFNKPYVISAITEYFKNRK
jgi:hypothetical protein